MQVKNNRLCQYDDESVLSTLDTLEQRDEYIFIFKTLTVVNFYLDAILRLFPGYKVPIRIFFMEKWDNLFIITLEKYYCQFYQLFTKLNKVVKRGPSGINTRIRAIVQKLG